MTWMGASMGELKVVIVGVGLLVAVIVAYTQRSDARKQTEPESETVGAALPPCRELAERLCHEMSTANASCSGLSVALALLSDRACDVALEDFGATKSKLKAQAKNCDVFVQKLCADMGSNSAACKTVREQATAFTPPQCTEMLLNIDKIAQDLKRQELSAQESTPGLDVQMP